MGDHSSTLAYPFDRTWSISESLELACLLEASAPKFGNVHPQASFPDMHFGHFLVSAQTVRAAFSTLSQEWRVGSSKPLVGSLVLESIRNTTIHVGCNTNLGTILLLAPMLVAAWQSENRGFVDWDAQALQQLVSQTLDELTPEDSRLVYEAIRLSNAGGLGEVTQHDVAHAAPDDLLLAMREVSEFDAVARQYVTNYAEVFDSLVPHLKHLIHHRITNAAKVSQTIAVPLVALVDLQLHCLGNSPDGLIVRKFGKDQATQVQNLAKQALESPTARIELDDLLRGSDNQPPMNPGTTADLIAATCFVQLLCG